MSWEKVVLQGIRDREDLSEIVVRAAVGAPAAIRNILENLLLGNLPNTPDLNTAYIKTLEKGGGSVLVLLYYYWVSLCGEFYHEFPLEMQRNILENGLKASIIAIEIASNLHEKKIEAGFLFRAGTMLYDLQRFSQAEEAYNEALTKYRELQKNLHDNSQVAKTLNNLGNLYCKTENFSKAEKVYTEALTLYRVLAKKNPEPYGFDVAMTVHNLGNLYRHTKKFSKAEKAYKKALRKYKALAKTNPEYSFNVAIALNNLGIVYWSTDKVLQAEKVYTKALKKWRALVKEKDAYNHNLAMTLSNLGNLYADTGNFSKAEKVYKEALEIRRALAKENPEVYTFDVVAILSNLGNFYSDINNFSKAEKVCLEALEIMKELLDEHSHACQSCKADTLNNLGTINWNTNRFSQAENAYTEALTLYKELAKENPDVYTPDVAMTLNNLGTLYSDTQDFKKAEEMYSEALKTYQELAEKNPVYTPDVAMTLNNLGTLFWHTNDFPRAEKTFTKTLKTYEALAKKNPDVYTSFVATTVDNLGSLYRHTHRFSNAEKAYMKALGLYRELAKITPVYTPDVAMTLNNLGTLFWSTTDFPQAEKAYTEALTLYRELIKENPDAYTPDGAMTLNNLGALYFDMRDFEKAEEMYSEALTVYKELAVKYPRVYNPDIAMTLNNVGAVYRRTKRVKKAEEAFTESLKRYRELAKINPDAFDRYVVIALNSLGNLYRTKVKKAKKAFNEALEIARNRALWFELAEIYDSFSHVLYDRKEDAIRALELGILFSGEEKYKYAQKGRREGIYGDSLEKTDDPRKALGILEALRDSDLLSLDWDSKEIEKAKKDTNLQKMLAEEIFKKMVHPRRVHFQLPDDAVFWYIQKMGDTLLHLVVTEEGTHLLRGTSEFINFGQKLLVNLRVQIMGKILRGDVCDIVTRFDELAAEWTWKLPPQILEILSEKDTIVFSPDAVISYFPLEGLLIDGEPICLSKKVMRATSINQLQEIVLRRLVTDSSLIVGNPWPSSDEDYLVYPYPSRIEMGCLKNAEKETEMLAENLPNPHVLVNSQATADKFLKELSDHSIIHFAGHGHLGRVLFFSGPMTRFPPAFESEEFAKLRKAWRNSNGNPIYMMDEWDIVTDIDILNTPLKKGALVFLSACETGQHLYAGGGHFQGLAQAFLKSGASTVISSLVPLYSAPARDFAVSFYDNLFSQESVATALQNARRKMKEQYRAHIYWLPYIHYGSPGF